MANKSLKIQPVVSEKSYTLASEHNKYVFLVPKHMNKIEVGKAVATEHKVKVTKVNIVTRPGKMKKNWAINKLNRKSDQKKAIVTLKDGDKIEGFLGA